MLKQTTAKNWLTILETLGILFYLHPYSNNVLKRTIKTPKLYFYDSGLVCYLTKWSDTVTLMNGAMSGAILEKSPLQRGTSAILCTSEIFSAFDKDNLIVPIWMI